MKTLTQCIAESVGVKIRSLSPKLVKGIEMWLREHKENNLNRLSQPYLQEQIDSEYNGLLEALREERCK